MKLIIAGSRSLDLSLKDLKFILEDFKVPMMIVTEIVSGAAKGIDSLGIEYAISEGIPYKEFHPEWENLDVPGAVIRTNSYGKKYNAKAGHDRNFQMAQYADRAVVIMNRNSKGSLNMIDCMNKALKQVYICEIENNGLLETKTFHLRKKQ